MVLVLLITENKVQKVGVYDFVGIYVDVVDLVADGDTYSRVEVLDLEQEYTYTYSLVEFVDWIESSIDSDELNLAVAEARAENMGLIKPTFS